MQEIERRNPLFARVASGRESYYQPTPQMNLNPAAQNLLGNFFGRNAAVNNAWRYQNPQYQNVQLSTIGNQAVIPAEARQAAMPYLEAVGVPAMAMGGYLANQAAQNAFLRSGMGTTPGNVIGVAAYPAAIMASSYMGRLAQPAFNTINSIANSPVGRWGAKLIDTIF